MNLNVYLYVILFKIFAIIIALPAIWAFENRAGKDIWADMGDYWGLLGIIGQQGKNPLFLVKKFKIETAILFLSFFWSKISGFW